MKVVFMISVLTLLHFVAIEAKELRKKVRKRSNPMVSVLRKVKDSWTQTNSLFQLIWKGLESEKDECQVPDLCKNGGICVLVKQQLQYCISLRHTSKLM